jgi:hypothetical protein
MYTIPTELGPGSGPFRAPSIRPGRRCNLLPALNSIRSSLISFDWQG